MHLKVNGKIALLNATKWKGVNRISPFSYLETCTMVILSHQYFQRAEKNQTCQVARIILFYRYPSV